MYDQNHIFALLMNEDGRKNVTHAFKNAGFVLPDKTQYDELLQMTSNFQQYITTALLQSQDVASDMSLIQTGINELKTRMDNIQSDHRDESTMTLENARDIANHLTTHIELQIQTLTERLTSFETQINTFVTLQNQVANLLSRIDHLTRIDQTLTERLTSLETQINTFVRLQNQVADLLTRIDTLENRIIDIETAGSGA